jgi:hypothetical protein
MRQNNNLRKHLFFVILSCLPLMTFAQMFSVQKQEILSLDKQAIGTLYKGVSLEQKADVFTLSGWVMDGNEYIVFYSDTQRIKMARLEDEFTIQLKVKQTKEDEYGVLLKKVTLDFKLKESTKLTKDEHSLWKEEEELYARCGSCHNSFPAHEFTANQWPPIMKTMQDNAGFSKQEAKAVSLYLQYESIKEK